MKNILKIIAITLIVASIQTSCTDDSYLVDGGKSNPVFDGTVWDFICSRPDYFAELKSAIEIAGMESVFRDDEITFFAPPDPSLTSSLNYISLYRYSYQGKDSLRSLAQIKPEIWREFIGMYIIKGKYLLKDIPQIDTTMVSAYGGQAYVSYNGRPMNMGVVYYDVISGSTRIKYAGYRQLIYSYIYDFTDRDMQNAYVATSDIQTSNGVVHVIRFSGHIFGFDQRLFAQKAIAAGIEEVN
jgi:hypothetical protein